MKLSGDGYGLLLRFHDVASKPTPENLSGRVIVVASGGWKPMYCSTCGVAVADSLNYCNHCGARTSNSDNVAVSRHVKPDFLVAAMVGTFVLGLIAITALLGVMKSVLGLEAGQILGFAVLSFLIMLFLEGVFLVLLFRRNHGAEDRARKESLPGHTTKELGAPQVQALREPLSSVTDETTRAFEPIYTNRNKAT